MTVAPVTWTVDLLTGLAQYLAANGIGTYRETGAYQPGDPAPVITFGATLDTPDELLELADYTPVDDPVMADVVQPIQLMHRGTTDPMSVRLVIGRCFTLLHGVGPLTLGGVAITRIERRSMIPLGADPQGRWEASENYAFHAARPTASRPD